MLFDTGATKSVMSGAMYRQLKLGSLDMSQLPSVVGANGSSLGALGCTKCKISIGESDFEQTFLVCENLKRPVILGKDFARRYCIGIYWTPENTRILHSGFRKIAETKELRPRTNAAVYLKRTTKLPPRSCAVVDVNINTEEKDKIKMVPDNLCLSRHPNKYMYTLHADLSEKKKDTVTPFVIINLSTTENLRLIKDTVVAFTEKDEVDGEVFEIDTIQDIEDLDPTPRNWVPWRPGRMSALSSQEADLEKVFTSATNFIKSPAEVETHRKVDLEDREIKSETKDKFNKLCDKYDNIISKNSEDIGKTLLVEMDIDTGDSPPIASKPYTLPLKHYDWVKKEIDMLE